MKKIFMVTGELSGDYLGAWYLSKLRQRDGDLEVQAIGGDQLKQAGAHLYERFEQLNVTGVVEILRHVPRLLKFLKSLVSYLVQENFDEVVVVDFPGFNLQLIKRLKKAKPSQKITYFCPPQLWCWGSWRLKNLKKYCDQVIVIYPFEKKWYQDRGLHAEWIGSPLYDRLLPQLETEVEKKTKIALLPGSRRPEVEMLLPVIAPVVLELAQRYPELSFVLPRAASLSRAFLETTFQRVGLSALGDRLKIIDEHEKYQELKSCCCALTKPGTITLELALLAIPSVVMYQTSWTTYALAKPFVQVKKMALPNLLLGRDVFPELIQRDCTPEKILEQVLQLYDAFKNKNGDYEQARGRCVTVKDTLSAP